LQLVQQHGHVSQLKSRKHSPDRLSLSQQLLCIIPADVAHRIIALLLLLLLLQLLLLLLPCLTAALAPMTNTRAVTFNLAACTGMQVHYHSDHELFQSIKGALAWWMQSIKQAFCKWLLAHVSHKRVAAANCQISSAGIYLGSCILTVCIKFKG
jgi:hypothetical protein